MGFVFEPKLGEIVHISMGGSHNEGSAKTFLFSIYNFQNSFTGFEQNKIKFVNKDS